MVEKHEISLNKRIPLLKIQNSATTERPTGPNAPCLSLVTHIEGKEGEAAALGGGSRFTKYKRNSFQRRYFFAHLS